MSSDFTPSNPTLSPEDAFILIHTTPALFCKATADGRFVWLVPGWEQLLGMDVHSIMERRFLEFVHPEDRAATVAAMEHLDQGRPLVKFENRYRRVSGEYLWLRWHAKAAGGFYYAVATEVTEERLVHSQLNESLRLLDLAEKLAKIGHWRIDLVTEDLLWSDEVFAIHGLDPATHTPTVESAIAAYHPDDREQVAAHIDHLVKTGQPFEFQLRLVRSDGVVRDVVSRGQPELDDQGNLVAVIGIFQDVSEQRQMQARIQQAERLRSTSTLAAGIAHEINNPLQYVMASIALAVEQLRRPAGGADAGREELRELLGDAEYGIEQVAQIVQSLKSLTSAAELEHAPVPINLLDALETSVSMTRNEVRHHAQLVESYGELPTVLGRESEFVQVFINLITNAVQAVRMLPSDRAKIRISSFRRDDGWAIVDVEDNGLGVPLDDQLRVFEPFFTTKGVGQGTGLGLHISRGILEREGGRIGLESAPGRTRFRVELPPAPSTSSVDSDLRPEALTLMIIDDDHRVAKATARMVTDEYTVLIETSPADALARIRSGATIDAMLCDIVMPGMSGWELIEVLRREVPMLVSRTVLMTGASGRLHRPSHGASILVLDKPFGPERLRAALRSVLSLPPRPKPAVIAVG